MAEELRGGAVVRQYSYGHDLASQRQLISGSWLTSFYAYDGHGSVRQLTDSAGAVTDAYTYDAFGALIAQAGSTPNEYLYAGERLDPETGLYYLRARQMNPATGRFWSMDSYEGIPFDPPSLHKYLYANADPVNNIDPTGHFSLGELNVTLGNIAVVAANTFARLVPAFQHVALRFAYWVFANQAKIELGYYALSIAAHVGLQASTKLLLYNEEPVQLASGNPGQWVENKIGANATQYELIDDFTDGNITSVKTNQQSVERLINMIDKEANTLGNRKSDIQPMNSAPSSVKPIPMSSVRSRTLLVVIPETNAGFLRDPRLLQAVRQLQQSTRVVINVVPLRGWRK